MLVTPCDRRGPWGVGGRALASVAHMPALGEGSLCPQPRAEAQSEGLPWTLMLLCNFDLSDS